MPEIASNLSGRGMRIAIVRARFNENIGAAMLTACRARLLELGVSEADIVLVSVPGALEVPLALQKLAASRRFEALVALGAVIRGETYHFEIVSNESAAGISQVQLDCGIPIANGILTTETDAQAEARAAEKGGDCAAVAIEMANLGAAIAKLQR